MPTLFRKDYSPTCVMVFHTVFTAGWLLFPHTSYSTSIPALQLLVTTMSGLTPQDSRNHINKLPAELTLHIASCLSEQYAFGSLLNFAVTTKHNWQTVSDELFKTIFINSDTTIETLHSQDVASGSAAPMSRWKSAKRVILDYIPSKWVCERLATPENYPSWASPCHPMLPSVEQLEVTSRCLDSCSRLQITNE
jgi:hypothetical protein